MSFENEPICALATANGIGAIAVIRASGKRAIQLISPFFSKDLVDKKTHTLHFGVFSDRNGKAIDEVLLGIFHEGKSFTGEESVEISCHGSVYIQQQILQEQTFLLNI
jgi:tRNA modification GTPase